MNLIHIGIPTKRHYYQADLELMNTDYRSTFFLRPFYLKNGLLVSTSSKLEVCEFSSIDSLEESIYVIYQGWEEYSRNWR